jgi:ABC-type multidrug transport system ATPase subunit
VAEKSELVDISFQDISYVVDINNKNDGKICQEPEKRVLLDGVTGFVGAGTVTAVMGASGAGKTTLLNVLACRVPQRGLSGTVQANGRPYDFDSFGDFGNYVMQGDVLMQTLTVR